MPVITGKGGLVYTWVLDNRVSPAVRDYGQRLFPLLQWSEDPSFEIKDDSELISYRGPKIPGEQHPVYHWRRTMWQEALVLPNADHPQLGIAREGENQFYIPAQTKYKWWWAGNGTHIFRVTADNGAMYNPDYASQSRFFMKLTLTIFSTEKMHQLSPEIRYPEYYGYSTDMYVNSNGWIQYGSGHVLGWDSEDHPFADYDYNRMFKGEDRIAYREMWYDKAAKNILQVCTARWETNRDHIYGFLRKGTWPKPRESLYQPSSRKKQPGSLFNERSFVANDVPVPVLRHTPELFALQYDAYYDAVCQLQSAGDSNIVNIVQLCCTLLSFAKGYDGKIPKNLWDTFRNIWLAGRYELLTTVSDAEELTQFIGEKLYDIPDEQVLHGHSTKVIDGVSVVCRCTIKCKYKPAMDLKRIWAWLRIYGLQLNLYQVWDFIPFSFIVDWFAPVGDFLESMDWDATMHTGLWQMSQPMYSLKYVKEDVDFKEKFYTRWFGTTPISLIGANLYIRDETSDRTKKLRVLDSATLFL